MTTFLAFSNSTVPFCYAESTVRYWISLWENPNSNMEVPIRNGKRERLVQSDYTDERNVEPVYKDRLENCQLY